MAAGESTGLTGAKLPSKSFLDKLQQRAHERELDFTNTSPLVFWALALVQIPITQGASYALSLAGYDGFGEVAAIAVGMHVLGFAVSVAIKSCFMFDLTGEITFTAVMPWNFARVTWERTGGAPSTRQYLATGLALVWCIRLGFFLFRRILVRGSDWRFDKLIKAPAYNFFGWVCQGSWVWLQGFCLWSLNASDPEFAARPIGASDVAAAAVWAH